MNKNKDPWTEQEIRLVHAYKDRILEESGGNGVSKKSPSLIQLQLLCENRTPMAVHNKVRITLMKEGSIITRKQMAKKLTADKNRSEIFDYTSKEPVIVSVPLSKLYGKVDFHTFMSLINE